MILLIKKYPLVLLFGILTTMFSGPGQTFLVSLFIPPMRETFALSKTQIAGLYSAATVISAMILPLTGRLVDRVRLLNITLIAGGLLAFGCLFLSKATSIWMILVGFLFVRNLGQGTLTMISSTTMARTFGPMRGKALAIANLGYPLSEAIFPLLITSWLTVHGWRSGWVFLACLTLAFYAPLVFLLVRKDPHDDAHAEIHKDVSTDELDGGKTSSGQEGVTAGNMLRDVRYYMLMYCLLMGPGFLTALFFHQASLLKAWKGWDLTLLSSAFIVYAVARVCVSFVSGILVDKFSARGIFPFTILPLGIGFLTLLVGTHPALCFLYLGFAGISMGFAFTTTASMFAELYGTKHLGAIKGTNSAMIVLSTAIAPLVMGFLLDHQVKYEAIFFGMFLLVCSGCVSAKLALTKKV